MLFKEFGAGISRRSSYCTEAACPGGLCGGRGGAAGTVSCGDAVIDGHGEDGRETLSALRIPPGN
jgi:hypothetical protein